MSAPKRRKTTPQLALRIARAQLKAVRAAVGHFTSASVQISPSRTGEPMFVQCWAVSRGPYISVTQALDNSGQVWERVTLMEDAIVDGVKKKIAKSSWWEKVPMTRKETET